MDAVHATLPQTQVTELAADPSVFVQAVMGAVPHALSELSQYMPLKELHAPVPHAQSTPVLSEDPSTLVQGSPLEQVLVEEVQKRPEAAVHPVSPHRQVAVFDVTPMVCVQSGAAMHRQNLALLVHD